MKTKKQLWALLLALVCGLSLVLAACSSDDDGSGALTEDEYLAAFEKLSTDLEEVEAKAAEVQSGDVEAGKAVLEECKAPLQEFIDMVPPEAFAEAHTKLQSGCTSMIAFLDTCIDLLDETDPDAISAAATTMMEQIESATADLMEGGMMLEEAAGA